ncbi:MAG: VOC family protein [Acidimicrobiales bacterium]|nr:VOC family protein [Acidimicrobiales bacterium]
MPVTRLNHAVLYVRDIDVTRAFYEEVLGFTTLTYLPGQGAFFRAPGSTNDHDLGAFQVGPAAGASEAGRATVGLYHLAWEVDTLDELERLQQVLQEHGALVGASDHVTTKSLYAQDPDGIEFEVCWILPADALTPELVEQARAGARPRPLDLAAEQARHGGATRGGVGISHLAPAGPADS